MTHPVLTAGRVAVVTGAAMGIGFAACRRFAGLGMKVCMADVDRDGAAGGPCAARRAHAGRREERSGRARGRRPCGRSRSAPEHGLRAVRRGRPADEQRREPDRRRRVGAARGLARRDGRQLLGRGAWRAGLRAAHDRAADAVPGGQHGLQAGHHQSARQHRLQHHQVGAEDLYRRLGARAAQYGRTAGSAPTSWCRAGRRPASASTNPAPGCRTR